MKPGHEPLASEVGSDLVVAQRCEEWGNENGYTDAWAFARAYQAMQSLDGLALSDPTAVTRSRIQWDVHQMDGPDDRAQLIEVC